MNWTRVANPPNGWNSTWYSDENPLLPHPDGSVWLVDVFNERVFRYDPTANSWTELPPIIYPPISSEAHGYMGATFVGSTLYLIALQESEIVFPADGDGFIVYTYNPSTGSLTQIDLHGDHSLTGGTVGVSTPNADARCAWAWHHAGTIYWMGTTYFGAPTSTGLATYMFAWELASHTWTAHRMSTTAFGNEAVIGDDSTGLIYTVAGFFFPGGTSTEPNVSLPDIRQYDFSTGSWTTVGTLPDGVNAPCLTIKDRTLHIMAGWWYEGGGVVPDNHVPLNYFTWDLDAHVLTHQPDLPVGSGEWVGMGVTLGNGDIMFGGGWDNVSADVGFWRGGSANPNLVGALAGVSCSFDP